VRSVGAALGMDLTLPAAPSSATKTSGGEAAEGAVSDVAGVKRSCASGDDLRGDFRDLDVGDDGSTKKRRK
jgi:hypothetical protein